MKIILKLWLAFSSAASKKSSITIFSIVFLVLMSPTRGQESPPSLTPEFSQKNAAGPKYKVGDRIQLTLRLPIQSLQDMTSISLKPADEKKSVDDSGLFLDPNPQIINGNLQFVISPIQTGKKTLPSLLVMKNDSLIIAQTSEVEIDVENLEAKPDQTPILVDVQGLPIPLKLWLIIISVLVVLGLIGFFVYRKLNSRKPAVIESVIQAPPPTPDHVIALRELNMLYEQHPFSKENLKPVSFGISQILKNYFSARFKIDARESTTDEMIDLLKRVSIGDREIQKIRELFRSLDLIKFTELAHHDHFQKADYLEFKELTRQMIDQWAVKEPQV